jgi:5-hydroxyisourate hydrolase
VPGISIHAVDVARGLVAAGMRVELLSVVGEGNERRLIARGVISARGTLDDDALAATFAAGHYEAVFHVGAYYRDAGISLPRIPFLDVVSYRFGISQPQQHHHLPFKFTAWGYSCFRGGA